MNDASIQSCHVLISPHKLILILRSCDVIYQAVVQFAFVCHFFLPWITKFTEVVLW